jgi:hypothetical protein
MSATKIFNGYWQGYQPGGNDLSETPSYVNKVTLFVAAPSPDGKSLDTGYMTSKYTAEQQIAWAQKLQTNGVEVLMTVMDTPTTHWNDVDIPSFVQNFKNVAIDGAWGLNGVDIDMESQTPGDYTEIMISLIQEFRKVLGPIGSVNVKGQCISRLSVAAFTPDTDGPVLEVVGGDLDWLNTMAYGDSAAAGEALAARYLTYVSQVNMGIGVVYQGGQSTDLTDVGLLAKYARLNANYGMMQFPLNNDCEAISQNPQWTWASAINTNMNG